MLQFTKEELNVLNEVLVKALEEIENFDEEEIDNYKNDIESILKKKKNEFTKEELNVINEVLEKTLEEIENFDEEEIDRDYKNDLESLLKKLKENEN